LNIIGTLFDKKSFANTKKKVQTKIKNVSDCDLTSQSGLRKRKKNTFYLQNGVVKAYKL